MAETTGHIYKLNSDKNGFGCNRAYDMLLMQEHMAAYIRCHNPHKTTMICEKAEILDRNMQVLAHICCKIDLRMLEEVGSAQKAMYRIQLTDAQKRGYNADQQALVEAGYYDHAMNLTNTQHFINFLVGKFEAEYAADAKAKLAADDAEKAQAKAAQAAVNKVSK